MKLDRVCEDCSRSTVGRCSNHGDLLYDTGPMWTPVGQKITHIDPQQEYQRGYDEGYDQGYKAALSEHQL